MVELIKILINMDNRMTFKALIASVSFLLLAGCATNNQFVVAEYEKIVEEKFPPISVYYQTPPDELRQFCNVYKEKSALHDCFTNIIDLENFYDEFNDSKLFENVYYAEKDVDFKVLISTANYYHSSGADLGRAAIAGATLLLAPLTNPQDIKVEAAITWKDHVIQRYQYDIPFTAKASLFSTNRNPESDMAKSIASYLMKSFQESEVFTPEFLSKEIESSNYSDELTLPEFVGEYQFSEDIIFHNPLNGVVNRYTHQEFLFDYVDVFVYPVRHWDLNNGKALIEREIGIIKNEIDLLLQESNSSKAEFDEPEFYSVNSTEGKVSFAALSGDYLTEEKQRYKTVIYLYQEEDKFIKFRSTFEADAALGRQIKTFVDEVAGKIQVPEESLFMAQIRQSWRENALEPL
ncbi:hypothetical protein NBRC116591_10730 [Sessilibacter corallicola]|uniref:Lipoprotein n=2 Tax=Sessilibacter corallicola TaxID=2904075 RepID=A0ABQ0A6I0_9GAMM